MSDMVDFMEFIDRFSVLHYKQTKRPRNYCVVSRVTRVISRDQTIGFCIFDLRK